MGIYTLFSKMKVMKLTIQLKAGSNMNKYSPIIFNRILYWNWNKIPHAQISGTTGSGKTVLIYYLLLSFLERGAFLSVIDPKRGDLAAIGSHLMSINGEVAFEPNQIAKILRTKVELMNQRYSKYFMNNNEIGLNFFDLHLRPHIILIDEILALIEEDPKVGKECERYIKQLILKGRQAGIQVIIATQRLSADALDPAIRENCGLRISLGKLQAESYKMALGMASKSLPNAVLGVGKGYIYMDGMNWGTPKPFNAPILDLKSLNLQKIIFELQHIHHYFDE